MDLISISGQAHPCFHLCFLCAGIGVESLLVGPGNESFQTQHLHILSFWRGICCHLGFLFQNLAIPEP